jgi:1,4-dihydroxy-2-naphthoyl-CoA hydrolase
VSGASASVFRREATLEALNALSRGNAISTLGIEFTELGADFIRATMPVDGRTRQPYGLLHGGASVLLAETLGSSAGNLCVGEDALCVGLEINANHLRAVREGMVTGTARPLHIGRGTQVWEVRIEDAQGRLACVSRITLAVVPRREGAPKP